MEYKKDLVLPEKPKSTLQVAYSSAIHMAQKRKNKQDMLVDRSDEDMGKHSHFRLTYMQRTRLKQLTVAVVCLLTVYIIYQIITSMQPSAPVVAPSHRQQHQGWPYTNNSQGMSEDSLAYMIKEIQAGRTVGWTRPPETADVESESDIIPLQRPYQSMGSLKFKNRQFVLDGKPLRIFSGAMHYFRVMPQYWEANMRKMKDCGLNTLETYVAWNLHEPQPGQFNFDDMLDIRKYIKLAQDVGLYVLFRPGPYICSEWDLGGLPAWLLRDDQMRLRTNYPGYQKAVERYFKAVLEQVSDLQYIHGGPIIGVQVENEHASYSNDVPHLKYLKQVLETNGVREMFFTSDSSTGLPVDWSFAEEALPTVNFKDYQGHGKRAISTVKTLSPDFPIVVMEFWTGWFDHWENIHSAAPASVMARNLQETLEKGASVNLYMFHGGTNFGFMAGANAGAGVYKPDVTSYDYVSPLSEAGDITPKYLLVRELLKKYEPGAVQDNVDLALDTPKVNYGEVLIDQYLTLNDLLIPVKPKYIREPVTMEKLDLTDDCGQNHGFILYRSYIPRGSKLQFTAPVKDRAQVLLNGIEVGVLTWYSQFWTVNLKGSTQADENKLEILVENHGRVNYGRSINYQHKGINSSVLLDDLPIYNWEVYPLEFSQQYMDTVLQSKKWKNFAHWEGPTALYRGNLHLKKSPADTFIRLKKWNKGIVFINGFNIGRYWNAGPQQTLYVPAPLLKVGDNSIVMFELHKASHAVTLEDVHILSS